MNNENYSFEKIALLRHAILDVMSEYHDSGKSLRSILREYRLSSGLDDKTLATVQFLTLGAVRFQNTIAFILYRCSNQKFKSLRLRGQILLRICLYWLRWQGMSYYSITGLLV
ncbi:MAG: hypothetical protein P1Q69_20655, partial [Candidatus Thorarchaeota archaeon]|nr:hypothetical protein [Candidatus Thorarchaeota archaeon]